MFQEGKEVHFNRILFFDVIHLYLHVTYPVSNCVEIIEISDFISPLLLGYSVDGVSVGGALFVLCVAQPWQLSLFMLKMSRIYSKPLLLLLLETETHQLLCA